MSTTVAPPARWTRQRLIVIAVLLSIVAVSAYLGLRYFRYSDCTAPILCTDPCTLPTFG